MSQMSFRSSGSPPVRIRKTFGLTSAISSITRRHSPPPPLRLSRFLVRHVPGDDFVHGLASVPEPLFTNRKVDRGDTLGGRHPLYFLARHVAHEPRGHAVEPRCRVLGPREAGAGAGRPRREPPAPRAHWHPLQAILTLTA